MPQVRPGHRALDEYELMGHYEHWREDLSLATQLGLKAMRWGVPWYKVEPEQGKGQVARATLYFLVRYPGLVQAAEMPADRLDMVLGWHADNAVGEYERHRNAAIHASQGNRNPFIDHPEWVTSIF